MSALAERYRDGHHESVWRDMAALGPDATSPEWRDDCAQVVDLTMERVAGNVATVVVRLTLMGYRFGNRYNHNRRRRTIEDLGLRASMVKAGRDVSWVDAGDVEESVMGWSGPRRDVDDRIVAAERLLGCPLPPALRGLVRHVDRVDLAGSFPAWNPSAYDFDDDLDWPAAAVLADPFNLRDIDEVADHADPVGDGIDPSHCEPDGRFALPIANDATLSANQPGGAKTVVLPSPLTEWSVDPLVVGVAGREGISLVDYLRLVFAWGGFPGLEFVDGPVPPEIAALRANLAPF